MKIAFDIDDTILIPSVANTGSQENIPNYEVIDVYRFFQRQGHHMILWSGSGVDWAQRWGEKFGLNPDEIRVKLQRDGNPWPDVDIAFDDCDVNLAKVNVRVKRINNGVSRKEWNETKRPNPPTREG